MPDQEKKTPCGIGLLAHVDAGKTTLSEAMLYEAGARRTLGRVDHQDAFLDTHALERARGITIFSKQALLETEHRAVTLVDTPGHVDFSAEAERIMPVLDCAVLVISGTDGVQAHTLTLWRLLERYQVPTFLFLNKMDLPGMGKDRLLAELRLQLSPGRGAEHERQGAGHRPNRLEPERFSVTYCPTTSSIGFRAITSSINAGGNGMVSPPFVKLLYVFSSREPAIPWG